MRTLIRSLLAVPLFAVLTVPAHAQLDPPRLVLRQDRPSSVAFDVVAGQSGAPSGFTVEWMRRADYDRLGGWPSDPNSMLIARGSFTGTPTYNADPDSPTYRLSGGADILVEIGDLFDETGVAANSVGELCAGQEYVFRVRANATPSAPASANSASLISDTSPALSNCTYTQGYWKNHAEEWPAATLTLGTVSYDATQLMSIFNRPANGNGLISLAHQLIACKLNILSGADPSAVASTIAAADALIGGLVVPPVGTGFIAPSITDSYTHTLDDFNNGLLGPGHCGQVSATRRTWGEIKAIWR